MADDNRSQALAASCDEADETMGPEEASGDSVHCTDRSWIEIELVGDDDQPIAGTRYRLELPDGRVVEGSLDQEGVASLEGIDPGNCRLTFPDLDQELWEPLDEQADPDEA